MFRSVRLLFAILAVHTLVLSFAAAARTDVVVDAVGDVPTAAPAYVDIVQTKVTEQLGRNVLFFHMELAGPAPIAPGGFVAWNWVIDAVPTRPGPEYFVVVRWCTQAMVSDCGPGAAHWESALIGASVRVNAFPFEVDGATVKAYLDPALIGDPAAFNWWSIARLFPGPSGLPPTDLAPNSGSSSYTR